jgi:hypothetical protein
VVGVGTIFGWYRDGVLVDDDEVAVYHAPVERGSRPFTVPLVDVRHAAALAVEKGLARNRDAAALVSTAAALHFGDRRWERILEEAPLARRARLLLAPFLRSAPSLKAQDARATIRAAAEWVSARRAGAPPPAPRLPPLPSHARRRRLAEALTILPDGAAVRGADVLAALAAGRDARRSAADGLRHALLAAFARTLGLRADPEQVARAERAWLGSVGKRGRAARLAALGLDDGAARALFEDLALEALLLDRASQVVPDGPSYGEGLALSARLSGAWRDAVERLAALASSAQRKRTPSASPSADASPPRARPPRAPAAPRGASPRRPPSRRRGE